MGAVWQAAKRGEGYQLARRDFGIVTIILIIVAILHITWRYVSGRPMLGDAHRKTDATFLRPGTRLLHPNARPPAFWGRRYCWSALPEYQRALIRIGVVCAAWGGWWLYTHPLWGGVAVSVLAVPLVWRGARAWRHRAYTTTYETPLGRELATLLGITRPARKWIYVHPDMPGLLRAPARPVGPVQTRLRALYGAYVEPMLRWVPDRCMRAWWWLSGRLTKGWRQ